MAGMSPLKDVSPVNGMANSIMKSFWSPEKPAGHGINQRMWLEGKGHGNTVSNATWAGVATASIITAFVRHNDDLNIVFDQAV